MPSPTRSVVSSSTTLGVITCLGLIGGLLDVKSSSFMSALFVLSVGIAIGIAATPCFSGAPPGHSAQTAITLIIPTLFFGSAVRWLFRPASIRLSWLFDTWDGTTNPGVVTYSMVTGNIGHDTAILSQWETYPRAPHFAIGQVARLAEGVGLTSASDRTTIYAIGLWFTYALMVAAVGIVSIRLAYVVGVDNRVARWGALLSQAFLVLATNLEKTLLLNSLSFLSCIAASVSLVAVWLSINQRDELRWRDSLVVSLHIVVVVETFPLILPFIAVILAVIVAQFRRRIPFQSSAAILSLSVPLAIAAPRLLDQFQHSTQTDHVSTGGHLLGLSTGLVVALGVIGAVGAAMLAFSHRSGRYASFLLVGSILVPAAAWAMVGNFDRTYGLNYYPKKVELFTLVVIVAMAPVAFLRLLSCFTRRLGAKMGGIATATLVVIALWNGPLTTPRVIALNNPARQYIIAAFGEADRASESVVFGPNGMMSALSSMMSNLVDKHYWSVGYTNDRLVTIFQQISVASPNSAPDQLCSFVTRRPAVVVALGQGSPTRLRCRP